MKLWWINCKNTWQYVTCMRCKNSLSAVHVNNAQCKVPNVFGIFQIIIFLIYDSLILSCSSWNSTATFIETPLSKDQPFGYFNLSLSPTSPCPNSTLSAPPFEKGGHLNTLKHKSHIWRICLFRASLLNWTPYTKTLGTPTIS